MVLPALPPVFVSSPGLGRGVGAGGGRVLP